jgi:ABC-type multidrug transport system fused ATPase/permease subunit
MFEKPLQFQHLLDIKYSFSLVYGSLIVLCALLLPLFISFICSNLFVDYLRELKIKYILVNKFKLFSIIFLLVVSTIGIYFILNTNFHPRTVSWGELPYLENTWERTGLYPRGVIGTKYQFKWNYDLYYYWDLLSKVVLSFFVSYILWFFKKKNFIDFNLIFIVLYFGIMLLTETFYDRYLLVLVPFIILFFVKNTKKSIFEYVTFVPFIAFLGFYSYQLTMDFVLVNSYVWNKSNSIVTLDSVEHKSIQGTNAWKLNYRNIERNYLYDFSYDSRSVNPKYKNEYDLIEVKEIKYPLNIFIEPKIYLYKKR